MSSVEQFERVFLGTKGPALHAAAGWLMDTLGEGPGDLGCALVVVPGRQAERRLMELLAAGSAGRALVPPTVVTLGGLADRLMQGGDLRVASGLESLLVWGQVLREADAGLMAELAPHGIEHDDWPSWWALAEQVIQAADELGAQLLGLGDVADRTTHGGDEPRWRALSVLAQQYEAELAGQGLIDRHAAQREAIAAERCGWDGPVVLLATADLRPVQSQMLACLKSRVVALIAADERDADGFDGLGGLVETYWTEREIEIDDASIDTVDRPIDQVSAVLDAIRGWSEIAETSAEDITVGLGDTALGGPIARALELSGIGVHQAAGRHLAGARPVSLLRALSGFANGLRFDRLAELLRHPDAEQTIAEESGEPTRPWLTLLDRYASKHLAARPTGGWLGDADQVQAMEAVYRAACSLLPDPMNQRRPIQAWAEPIGQALLAVYGQSRLNRHVPEDRPVVVALEQIGIVIERLGALDARSSVHCTFSQAVMLVLSQLAGQSVPEPGGEPAVELVGYLELLLDDAPWLVIAGMNEQHVPGSPSAGALLPEGTRRSLGLPGDARRLARDGYALSAMLAWRTGARLIVGRRSREGDPLLPSRLLLRADDETMIRRVSDFVSEQVESQAAAPMLLTPGKHDRFLIPRPVLLPEPITKLRATAFRDYLACPYRFYLKHVLKLEVLDDKVLEISAGGFGTLAHEALRVLGAGDLVGVEDAGVIGDRLSMKLDETFRKTYGEDPPAAARVQAEQLRYRLMAFSKVQAELVQAGWRIVEGERGLTAEVAVDGEPFTISGQVDRIDRNGQGDWRLIDYKTSDTAKAPEKTHRKRVDGELAWVDLQLPLYLNLSAGLGVDASAELAYINLPKKMSDTAYVPAQWSADELAAARQQRDFVIRQVRAGVFWPPKQPPSFDDGLGGLCADAVEDRGALIQASGLAGIEEGGER